MSLTKVMQYPPFAQILTLILFTKSDIKTTFIPITIFAAVAAPAASVKHLLQGASWLWLHLLQFTTSNQTCSDPVEDKINKPDRPMASGRISHSQALVLRWALVPICLLLSACYSHETVIASATFIFLTIWYNEFRGHSGHWIIRSLLNAFGFGAFEWGTTLVAGSDRTRLDNAAILSVVFSVGIYATTTHTQDFKDEDGDKIFHRPTIPLVLPKVARPSVLVLVLMWSIALPIVWEVNYIIQSIFGLLGLFVGMRFCLRKGRWEDQLSFYWYNVWLSAAHALPGIWRVTSARA